MKSKCRRIAIPLVALALAGGIPPLASSEVVSRASIDVRRILVDVRVTEWDGTPVRDLDPDDFTVRIGRQVVAVESADWIGPDSVASDEGPPGESPDLRRPGRRFVFFFQTDFQRARAEGQMKMIAYADEILRWIGSNDEIAVVQHDSRLRVRLDFTRDQKAVREAMRESLRIDDPRPHRAAGEISLVEQIDDVAARRAASIEKALDVLGSALASIEGPKNVILFGWGVGRYGAGGVRMTPHYRPALQRLLAARASIWVLDVTDADYHSLEVGLQQVAEATGGSYYRTNVLPLTSVRQLFRGLGGHWELSLVIDEGFEPAGKALSVGVRHRNVSVLHPSRVVAGSRSERAAAE